MSSQSDWRREITARAHAAGVKLADATVEEMAEHLDELYAAAVRGLAARAAGRQAVER